MILNGQGWHYFTANRLPAVLSRVMSKNDGDFYCLSFLHSFTAENVYGNFLTYKDFCETVLSSEDTKILEFNQYPKSDKSTFIVWTDLEFLIERIDGCKNNLENLSAAKVGKHMPSDFLMCTMLSFKSTENKDYVYRD